MPRSLATLPPRYRAVVCGAGGAIGAAFVRALSADERCDVVFAGARRDLGSLPLKVRPFRFDLEDEASIATAFAGCAAEGPLHLVVVATGVLHAGPMQPEKTWRSLSPAALRQAFAINAIGPALIARYALEHLPRQEKGVFAALSARVGSISDNQLGGWHAYRSSKAALNMLLRTLAIELARKNRSAICVGLHPGTVDTPLSRPFQSGMRPGVLFTPDLSVDHLLQVVDGLTPVQSGNLYAWDGTQIPF